MQSPESLQPPIIEMATGSKSGKKPEKSPNAEKISVGKTQEQLRANLEKRFGILSANVQAALDEYEKSIEEGTFEDKSGEETGVGDKRKELAQVKIENDINRVENMKKTLDSKEELPQSTPQIEASYAFTDPKTNKVERREIMLDIEEKIAEFIGLYTKTGIDLPTDFEGTIRDIWERSGAEIQEAIEQNGFDEALLIPGGQDIGDISKKMKMGNGYYEWIKSSKNVSSLDGIPFADSNTDKVRIVLVHKDNAQNMKDRPELAQTLNVKGQDVDLAKVLTLREYIIFQRKYFEETGKHLDEESWTWLSTKSGARLVSSSWDPDRGRLSVYAHDLGSQYGSLGARPSRSFF